MEEYSNNLEFEKAASVRDRIQAIERISEKQKVANFSENNIDVIRTLQKRSFCMY